MNGIAILILFTAWVWSIGYLTFEVVRAFRRRGRLSKPVRALLLLVVFVPFSVQSIAITAALSSLLIIAGARR
jgi:hypothetical protein